ncbi:MAG: ATP-binding protein [Desulfobacteraceae bacterium]|nr:ATP-binding protein [Desulfobacteraceae bacterium]
MFIGIYYLRLYYHPLTRQLSKTPASFTRIPLEQLSSAKRLLKKTRRLKTILTDSNIHISLLESAISFSNKNAKTMSDLLINRFGEEHKTFDKQGIKISHIRLHPDFMLNMETCLLAFPPEKMPASQVLNTLKQIEDISFLTCLIISKAEQQANLRKESHDITNWFVTPDSRDMAELLLSPDPLESLARVIASQIDLTRISPYQPKSGLNRENVFFGRSQLLTHILQREPANYLLVGGRQIGKSTLLKEIKRRCIKDTEIICHYTVLTGKDVISHMANALNLPPNAEIQTLLSHIRQFSDTKRHLFLIDEADMFIEAEAETGYKTLHLFRSLSEEGRCYFILAGFWSLYRIAAFDYHSPIKNFGETLQIGALEPNACWKLATIPMNHLNISYESDRLVETILKETGRRANLIAITCNEILKNLDMQERTISEKALETALYSEAMQTALAGWGNMSGKDESANRLDRIIICAGIHMEEFTQKDILQLADKYQLPYEPEAVRHSLARLELSFILEQNRMKYSFRVPIFKKMILEQGPEEMLKGELRHVV